MGTRVKYHYTTVRSAKIKKTDHTRCWWGFERAAVGRHKGATVEKHFGGFVQS